MDHQLSSNNANKKYLNYYVIFLLITFLVLIIFINTGLILDKMSNLSYYINPDKKNEEYEQLTKELMALYSSMAIEYYQENFSLNSFVVDNSNLSINQLQAQNSQNESGNFPSDSNSKENITLNSLNNYIYIPRININAPLIKGTSADEKTILNQLKNGVLIYPGSSLPGEGKNTIIIGHSSSNVPWQKYGRIFSKLPELASNDIIIINYNGKKYEYRVNQKFKGSVQELVSLNIQSDLILGTCWPIGSDEKRIIVTASLLN
jgi:LPXTG-site transpeptidase (sortase) family protein